mmetsp:Transcript_27669/g.70546  ORF Transcript_27669/g.70546 Transcript_27669/m.70546 type:complete len:103 (+) Transcript_27669:70-378(+)
MAEEPEYDVAINVHKGQSGYGIYFTQDCSGVISVTKLDHGSQAQMAGVQPGDMLHSVQDLEKKLPAENPGAEIRVGPENYQQSLQLVRQMKYCRLTFKAKGF